MLGIANESFLNSNEKPLIIDSFYILFFYSIGRVRPVRLLLSCIKLHDYPLINKLYLLCTNWSYYAVVIRAYKILKPKLQIANSLHFSPVKCQYLKSIYTT